MKHLIKLILMCLLLELGMQAITFVIYGKLTYNLPSNVISFHVIVLGIFAFCYVIYIITNSTHIRDEEMDEIFNNLFK